MSGRLDNSEIRQWKNTGKNAKLFLNEHLISALYHNLPLPTSGVEDKYKFHKNYDKEKMYIIKPVASSRGRGIKLLTKLKNIPERCLISDYISNPLIINNKKEESASYTLPLSLPTLVIILRK